MGFPGAIFASSYAFSGWSFPPGLVAVFLLGAGLQIFVRRPLTTEAVLGGRYVLASAAWLAAMAIMYSSADEQTALFWARVSFIATASMPVFAWSYSRVLSGGARFSPVLGWVIAVWIMGEAWYSDTAIASMKLYWWGYYPQYGPVGVAMIVFTAVTSGIMLLRFALDRRRASVRTSRRSRDQLMLVGVLVGSLGYLDFVACFGIAFYPFGYAAFLVMLLLINVAVKRYGLLSMSLTNAAEEVLRVVDDALLAVDADGQIRLANPAAVSLFGGRALDGGMLSDLDEFVTEQRHRRTLGTPARSEEIERDGRRLELRSVPVRDATGTPVGRVYLARDVTEAAESLREVRHARSLAEAAAAEKDRFLATMSHEIRTPLNGVIGLTELMLDTELDDEQREYAAKVRGSGQHLLGVVNDILDFSRLEAGGRPLRNEHFSLPELIGRVADMMGPQAREKGFPLRVHVRPDVPQWSYGDPQAVTQVLVNLVGNAIKFTEEGEVSLSVRPSDRGFEFVVRDTGIGIPGDLLPRLFERFSQVDGSLTRHHGGSGLGLAISARLSALMDGSISASSVEGEGSEFRCLIPMSEGRPPSTAPSSSGRSARLKPGVRVLVAEDNEVNQMITRRVLEDMGALVDVVGNGAEAMQAVLESAEGYSVILMDCEMPEVDGYTAARRLRQQSDGPGRRVPIVAMTAHAMAGERERCLEAGMDDYLPKPACRDDLERMVAKWARRQDRRAQASATAPE